MLRLVVRHIPCHTWSGIPLKCIATLEKFGTNAKTLATTVPAVIKLGAMRNAVSDHHATQSHFHLSVAIDDRFKCDSSCVL